jgi:hypothetical protein
MWHRLGFRCGSDAGMGVFQRRRTDCDGRILEWKGADACRGIL